MSKEFKFGQDARDKILKGINILARAVGATLGPRGRTVLIQRPYGAPVGTKDGVTVAREISLKDPFEDMGAQMAKQVASKTADVAGDGTTTATILAQSIINEGAKLVAAGHNPTDIKRGIDFAVDKVVEALQLIARPVKDKKEIEQVGTISANEDVEIGQMIAHAMEQVGNEGIISLEEGKAIKTELKVVNGYQFDRGYLSQHFATNEKLECVLDNALVLLAEKPISNVNVILPVLQKCHEAYAGRPLLIIAEEIGGDALPTLVVNHLKQSFRSCAVKTPGFGDRRKELLNDIAVLTGAQLVSEELGRKMENFDPSWLGTAKRVTVTKNSCTVVEGGGSPADIESRVNEIRNYISGSHLDEWDKKKQEERMAKLVGGVAVISVGAATEAEMKEKKDRVEDALNATRAAVQEGIVAGGGVAILKAAMVLDTLDYNHVPVEFKTGIKIIRKAAEEPMKRIVENAGGDATMVRITVMNNESNTFGYNARTEKYEDLVESGVIDPVKVVRCALQNAASVAGLVLTTECMIADDPDEKKESPQGNGMMM
jgi:chaperonin GroEL